MDVLFVEDDDNIVSSLIASLQSSGMTVRRVSRGEDALRAELPDVVLLDVDLPGIDGIEVCRRIRLRGAISDYQRSHGGDNGRLLRFVPQSWRVFGRLSERDLA